MHVSWKELCPTPKILYFCQRATAVTSCLSLWVAENLHVRGSCKLSGPTKKLTKNLYHKNYSTDLAPFGRKTEYEAGICHVRLLSKASHTDFSRHIKTGCHLPVCITRKKYFSRLLAAEKNVLGCYRSVTTRPVAGDSKILSGRQSQYPMDNPPGHPGQILDVSGK